jgi:hypothetical protein
MTEQITEEQLLYQERLNTGTASTNNELFERNGYLVIKNLWNPGELYHPIPEERGVINYWGKKLDQFTYQPVETQVEGSLARYWHPQYRQIHSGIRMKLEKELGSKLYNTYYYDRYYFPGQELKRHADRDACEISVTVHISTNLEGKDADWPIWIKTPDTYTDKKKTQILVPGENRSVVLQAGDGMVYKGCERPHWRDPMPTGYKRTWYGKKIEKEELYYHQIFFHYVLQSGQRAHCAWDRSF